MHSSVCLMIKSWRANNKSATVTDEHNESFKNVLFLTQIT